MKNKTPNRVEQVKSRYDALYKEKQAFLPMYQLVGEYVMTRKQNFLSSGSPGEFQTDRLFSSIAPHANVSMASSMIGNLWPNGPRSIKIVRPRNIPDGPDIKRYYEEATEVLVDRMDTPEAGLAVALQEDMLDKGAFGICGINIDRTGDLFVPVKYKAVNVKYFVVDENKDGQVDTVFTDEEICVRNVVEEYGVENVSEKTRKLYEAGDYVTKVRILRLVEPRRGGKYGFGNKNLPWASIHIEWDTNKILRESGFSQMPIIVSRFMKALGERYGRSPAMFALPAILRLNLVWEMLQRAGEKQLRPPLYLLDNGALGAGAIDLSPNALNVFNVSGIGEKAPIGQIFDIGDPRWIFELVEQLVNDITQAFYQDRLLDFNNEARMTYGEAQIRDRYRGESLSSFFTRQEKELFHPLVDTTFNILLDEGLLGVIKGSPKERELLAQGYTPIYFPQAIVEAMSRGQRVYDVKYISPARRIMRTEELQGLTQNLDIHIAAAGGGLSDILDNLDVDKISRQITELTGATEETLRDTKTIENIRAIRAEAMKQNQQLQAAQIAADVNMKGAQARSMVQGAINGRPRG